MLEKGKISPRQTGQLVFISIHATIILFVPAITATAAGHDAWLSTFTGSLFGLVTLAIVSWLSVKHPGQNLFQYSETVFGKYIGKLIGLAYVWLFLHMVAIIVREFGDFMTTSFMPNTPLSVFNFSLLVLCAWAVIAGLEAIARMNEFIIILVVSFLLLIITLSIGRWDLGLLLPFYSRGIMPILEGAQAPAAWHGEVVWLAVIIPFMTRPGRAFLAGAGGIIGSAILLTTGVVAALAVLGPELVSSFRFPFHLFTRTINIGDLLTRFEPVVMTTWVAGVFLKTSIFYYCASLGLAQVLGLSEYRLVVLPLGVMAGTLSILLFPDVTVLSQFLGEIWPRYSISIYFLGLPSLFLAVTLIREKIFGTKFGGTKRD
ncbi:GerAB/ArcD/ProY family transporter [Dethiobacter alkaliphilus]|uniref:Spore germination protein n=1 Tax=Dethiobacter alkaliphilus AHT 1 TaxID=555088 RepID=C0GEP4_DETAL|nr:endospore germination permease [Dethiobacter alkaliphilus]EEG78076.1 spore germination protein [Dethiobacter alkaliphilus AHT 1]